MGRKHVTDLKKWFTGKLKDGNIINAAWMITDEMKKQIIIKFNDNIPAIERTIYLRCIAESLMKKAATEDKNGGGESEFGNLMDMMQLREWRKEDEQAIKDGIPHNIV